MQPPEHPPERPQSPKDPRSEAPEPGTASTPEPAPETFGLPPRTPWTPRRKAGAALIALGILLILVGVLYVLESAWGSEPITSFAQRRSYDEVKQSVHRTFPVALLFGAAGFFTAWTGRRMVG